MNITDSRIDGGRAFDWGRASADYARFRDIYPEDFYKKIADMGLCVSGQSVLDLGTGTGVLPRNMYRFGAEWTATDISAEQIEQAKRLSEGMNILYHPMSAEELSFENGSFDVITACQCFFYFQHERIAPVLYRLLKRGGSLLVLYMAWLPAEDEIARKSEELVLKYNPEWTGHSEVVHSVHIPECYLNEGFVPVHSEEYRIGVRFTRESWHGRIKACRGIGASLSPQEIALWEREHIAMLEECAPAEFDVAHYVAVARLQRD